MDTDDLTFGYWVRRRRKALDLTQTQLAERVGCAEVTIRTIESGMRQPSQAMAERLATCLQVNGAERAIFLRAARAALAVEDLSPPVREPLMAPALMLPRRAAPPAPPNTLIGRSAQLAELRAMLQRPDVRLVTLSGLGGVGKTRVTAALLGELRSRFADGVAYVGLAAVHEHGKVAAAIVQALGLPEIGMHSALERLMLALADRELLLALDNCEHVVAVGPQLQELLAAAPRLKILVVSQIALQVSGEHEYPLAPLDLPHAVGLFTERAVAIRPDFVLNAANESAVTAICARLDGLPLAIELAAARSALLTPPALLERLDDRLNLLVRGGPDLPERQRTLRAAIDWSYELLGADQQMLLAVLGLFQGSFTLAAVELITGTLLDDEPVDQALEQLIRHSLVSRVSSEPEPRYATLGLIHAYANERLVERSDTEQLREQYAAYYAGLAEQAAIHLFGEQQTIWLERLQYEWPNLRAALEWSLANNQPERAQYGARLASSLWFFWYTQGYHEEGRHWLERVLRQAPATLETARAGYAAGTLAYRQGAYRQAGELARQSLIQCQAHGDTHGAAFAQGMLALAMLMQGEHAAAEQLAQAAQPALRASGHAWGIAMAQIIAGAAARFRGEHRQALACLTESLALFRQTNDQWGIATALSEQAIAVAWIDGDWQQAMGLLEESLARFRALNDRASVGHALHRLGRAARLAGEYGRARDLLREQLALFRNLGDQAGRAYALWEAAALMADLGRYSDAAALCSQAEALSDAIHLGASVDLAEYTTRVRAETLAALGQQQYERAMRAGSGQHVEQLLQTLDM